MTRGSRSWLTFEQIAEKYNSTEVATAITQAKLQDAELKRTQVRCHPDAPVPWKDE